MTEDKAKHMEQQIVERNGLPPIKFTGEEIGKADNYIQNGNQANRWTVVWIYRTKGGRYVAQVARKTVWQGERDHYSATSKAKPQEIIEWLKEGEETLGHVSQQAVEEACKVDPAFASAWVEVVE